jgi:uncharacterized protein
MSHNTTYLLSHSLTFIEKNYRVYNWLNGEYIEFEDSKHPFLNIISNNTNNFKKFKYKNSYDDFSWLLDNKFIVESQTEIHDIVKKKTKENNSDKHLQLTLLPAEMSCNFACTYCYEDRTQKSKMGNKHKEILLQYIQNHKQLESLHIAWFGGEPLLNTTFILEFSKEIFKWKKLNNLDYQASITTNAYYLTKDTFLELVKYDVKSYQITLDGLEDDHNKLRPLANGMPTFQTIINNLIEISKIQDIHFNIVIRVNFNENSNIDNFLDYIETINFSKDKRFSFVFRAIQTNWNNSQNEVFCKSKTENLEFEYAKKAMQRGLQKGDYMLFKDIGSTSCYASRENSLIVYPDLTIRKCSVALDEKINMVGYINNDAKLIKNKNWDLWTLNKFSIHNKEECKTCSFNAQCLSSSCPLKFLKDFEISCPDAVYNLEDISNNIIELIENE